MKVNIHPVYFEDAQVACSCGNMFTVASTKKNIHIELCYKCHPFFTGQQRFVDTGSRIDKFQKKVDIAKQTVTKKREEKEKQEKEHLTLKEMLQSIKH